MFYSGYRLTAENLCICLTAHAMHEFTSVISTVILCISLTGFGFTCYNYICSIIKHAACNNLFNKKCLPVNVGK